MGPRAPGTAASVSTFVVAAMILSRTAELPTTALMGEFTSCHDRAIF